MHFYSDFYSTPWPLKRAGSWKLLPPLNMLVYSYSNAQRIMQKLSFPVTAPHELHISGALFGTALSWHSAVHFHSNFYNTPLAAETNKIGPSVDIIVQTCTILFKNLIRGKKKKKGRAPDRGMFQVVIISSPHALQSCQNDTSRALHPPFTTPNDCRKQPNASSTRLFRSTSPIDTARNGNCPHSPS